jgi:riboflavin kinase/FMN adenylyltransferase
VEIHRDLDRPPPGAPGHALTIGVYDGVHIGHQAVIRATQAAARRHKVRTAVVTFDPHPAYVLRPESAPELLTDLEQKLDLLEACGVDTVVIVPFDVARSQETAEEFVARVVVGCLEARSVVVGGDFHFGKGRLGNVQLLTVLGRRHGFEVEGVELLPRPDYETSSVSSTAVRRAVASGDMVEGGPPLGRLHEIRGPVVEGDQRGRTIGFPTANVAVARHMALPADAVYAGWYVRPDGSRWASAVNVGKRPTFYQEAEHSLIEAHLIGFEGDLYGEAARVQLVEKLRPEQRFDGIDALAAQLRRDVAQAAEVLERTA